MTDDAEPTADAESETPAGPPPSVDEPIRETYAEYDFAGRTIATISDPENDGAWVRSDVTVPARP